MQASSQGSHRRGRVAGSSLQAKSCLPDFSYFDLDIAKCSTKQRRLFYYRAPFHHIAGVSDKKAGTKVAVKASAEKTNPLANNKDSIDKDLRNFNRS